MINSKITINEIANLAMTSKTTVSFYLNGKFDKMSEETRERIRAAIEETHYHPNLMARSLNRKNTMLLGVVIGDITNPFSNQIVKGIENVARLANYQIIFSNSNYDPEIEQQCVNQMLDIGVDGLIVQPTLKFKKVKKRLESMGVPVTFYDSNMHNPEDSWVKTKNYEATFDAVVGCIQKGYNEFIMITADPTVLSARWERSSGFIDALRKHGKEYATKIIDTDTQPDTILDFIVQNIKLNSRTLIFVPNCWALPAVYQALKKYYNLIPENIGLVGFDNTEWADLVTPSVTTIVQPAYREGQQATKILLDIIGGAGKEPARQELDCVVHWNESTNLQLHNEQFVRMSV